MTLLHSTTPNLAQSIDFYQKLGYEIIQKSDKTYVSNGKALIEINPDRYARLGIKLYKESWKQECQQLEKIATLHPIENGFVLSDGNGVWIYLLQEPIPIDFSPAEDSIGLTGNFAGLSIETTEMEKSIQIYKMLGFTLVAGAVEQGWASFVDETGMSLSLMKPLMCPHLFFNPSMTFFNGKEGNITCIENIRAVGIPIVEEITHFNKEGKVDNLVLRDPGGFGFFVFND